MSHHHHHPHQHQHHHSHRGERKVVPTTKIDLDMELEDEEEEEERRSRCSACLSHCRQVTTFLLSHVGLISLVVGYCIMGAFTFEVKQNMTKVREAVTASLWTMTKEEHVIKEKKWVAGALKRLQVITTIGYGHISPKTVWGKVVTIFYAILGIPLMLLCLSHIGDFMGNAFRFLYWKVCCFMCTRRPKPMRRHPGTFRRGRSLRSSSTTKHSGGPRGMKRSNIRRSARVSQRSADSAFSDPSTFSIADTPVRRVHSDEDLRTIAVALASTVPRLSPPHLRPYSHPRYNTFHAHHQRSSRSAEPASAQSPRNLPVLFNKYAEDVITDESEIRRDISFATRSARIKPAPERFVRFFSFISLYY